MLHPGSFINQVNVRLLLLLSIIIYIRVCFQRHAISFCRTLLIDVLEWGPRGTDVYTFVIVLIAQGVQTMLILLSVLLLLLTGELAFNGWGLTWCHPSVERWLLLVLWIHSLAIWAIASVYLFLDDVVNISLLGLLSDELKLTLVSCWFRSCHSPLLLLKLYLIRVIEWRSLLKTLLLLRGELQRVLVIMLARIFSHWGHHITLF